MAIIAIRTSISSLRVVIYAKVILKKCFCSLTVIFCNYSLVVVIFLNLFYMACPYLFDCDLFSCFDKKNCLNYCAAVVGIG